MYEPSYEHEQPVSAAALHTHLEHAYLAFAQAFQPTWNHDLGGTWFFTKYPSPLCNGVLRTQSSAKEINQLIERVTHEAQERQTPFLWLVGPSTQPEDLPQRLEAQGLIHDETVLGMLLDLHTLAEEQSQHPRLSIASVETQEQMKDWLHAFTTGFGFPESVKHTFFHLYQRYGFVPPSSCRFYLGTIDADPVATSLLFLDGQMAGIYAVATVPPERRSGIGTHMTRVAIAEARRLGYAYVTLQATAMGKSIYSQLGFLPVCSFQTYRWEPKRVGSSERS